MNKKARRGIFIFQRIQSRNWQHLMPRLTLHEQAIREDKQRTAAKGEAKQ